MADVIIRDNSSIVKAELELAKQRALHGIAHTAASFCADELEMTPRRVDTGNLKTSINGRVQGNTAIIGTNVEYAP